MAIKSTRKTAKKVNKKTTLKTKSPAKKKLSKVKPIPKGYAAITPYLIIQNAADALKFYKKAFGAKEIMRFAHPNSKKIMHAEIKIGDSMVMLAEECPEMQCHGPKSVGGTPVLIHLYVEKVDAVTKKAIASGAMVLRPLANQFYGDRSACVMDPFGHIWSISTHIEDVSPKEIYRRYAEGRC